MVNKPKRALVCGAGGFIGSHLVKRLKREGYWVRGVDLKKPEFSETSADSFIVLDLRKKDDCVKALTLDEGNFDEIYQLAADMGGMGFLESAECEIMHNSLLININMTDTAIKMFRVPKYFFSSSVCVYRDMESDEKPLDEKDAYPALPHNEYGWEKLYSERVALAYGRKYGTNIRIARFQNCYGHEGSWKGGREKAPAAISRKVAEIEGNEGEIEIWGDGSAIRCFTYIDDLVDGIYRLVQSDLKGPTIIGSDQRVTIRELVETVAKIAGKKVRIKCTDGPVGVKSRNFSKDKIKSIGWNAPTLLEEGIRKTYPWIKKQVEKEK